MDERAQAISFAEYYFALVDGIFPGLECNLAKDVMLNWFGRKIKGKKDVTTFIKSNHTRTLHVFTDIKPVSKIVCNKKQRNWLHQITDIEEENLETSTSKKKRSRAWKLYKAAVKYLDEVEIIDYTVQQNSSVDVETNDRDMYKENNPLDNLLEPEIISVDDEELQRNINESKLEEEMASTVKPIKRERGQGDRTVRAQTDTIKYMEAKGQVKFTRRVIQEDPWSYHWTSLKINYWMHHCKLQIAYSRRKVNEHPGVSCTLEHVLLNERCEQPNNDTEMQRGALIQPQRNLPTLEEIIGISNRLIPDVNNFGGYLKRLNYFKERDDFLKYFENEVAQKNPDVCLPSAHYVENKLTFECKDDVYRENFIRKFLYGNYQIHRIVYEKAETDGNFC